MIVRVIDTPVITVDVSERLRAEYHYAVCRRCQGRGDIAACPCGIRRDRCRHCAGAGFFKTPKVPTASP